MFDFDVSQFTSMKAAEVWEEWLSERRVYEGADGFPVECIEFTQ